MPQEHTLTAFDQWFLNEHRLDPITKGEFSVGDSVVICARCKTVSLRDSWNSFGGSCANCQGNVRLSFLFFSRGLLRPSASGSKNFKIVHARAFPSIRIPSFHIPSFHIPAPFNFAFSSAKLCLYSGVCSVFISLGICGFTYATLSQISESDALTETISEAFTVRHKQYLDFTHDWIGLKVSQVAAHKMDAFQNRLSVVSEKSETLPDAAKITLEKLSSLRNQADIPLNKLPALTKKCSTLEKEAPAQAEQTESMENGTEFSVSLSTRGGESS